MSVEAYHSLSKLLQGRLPVAHSRMTQPKLHTSIAPILPFLTPLTVSGLRYIGVPVNELASAPGIPSTAVTIRDRDAIVFWFFASTLAAPKSTNLMVPS